MTGDEQVASQKRTRRYGPKVTSGCLTCKRRRVKCDELRPACKRCGKYGTTCEGYKPAAITIAPIRRVVRPLLPNVDPLYKTPTMVSRLFTSDQELSYFQRFCIKNVKQLTGHRESVVWSRHVLQASEKEPCVRHAVIAIGALDFRKRGFEAGLVKPQSRDPTPAAGPEALEANRLEFTYREYGKAIACMKTAIAEKNISIRSSLITSLLFVCFEAYHGNSDGAAAQVYSAVEAMENYSKQRRLLSSKPNTLMPPPIDDDTVEMFSILEIQATSWGGDRRSITLHLERMQNCKAAVGAIPREFKEIGHAWRTIFAILLRAIHLRSARSNTEPLLSLGGNLSYAPMVTFRPLAGEDQHAELRSVMSQFRQWALVFEPFMRRAQGLHSSQEMLNNVMMLYRYYLASHMWAASGPANKADYYRCYTRELNELVRLCMMNAGLFDEYFSMDIHIVMTASGCGNELPAPGFEERNYWHLFAIAQERGYVGCCDGHEGSGMDHGNRGSRPGRRGICPEDCMAAVISLNVDAEKRTAIVKCLQGVRGFPGHTIMKENTVYW
ncbi:hypothetical protein BKA64DRAFT_336751 [Cadophora sp. MPI-SDFR-AT-0126]|nr:hypothetical protein BKA64DRAFT_336751 [Leotiomycetes sp. MPI-SDFR-AT-0126]